MSRPIAWVCETYEEGGKTEVRVIRQGMTRDEIIAAFPAKRNDALPFCRLDLVKAIILEARDEVLDGVIRQRGNIRGFWYERIFHTLIAVAGEAGDADNINSINSTMGQAWKRLVEGGDVTYTDLNLYSEKEDAYHIGVKEDSPYPASIVIVEKASLQEVLQDIADTYEISFACTGGQNSRAAAMAYATKLEDIGVDLSQDFTVYSFYDFDPEGWLMPLSFIHHLALKVTGQIHLVRLGLLKEQIGQSVIDHQAIPYSLEAKSARARKGKQTKYDGFVDSTGGLFIADDVPARVELNIYTPAQVREKILAGLAGHIDVFPYQVREIKDYIQTEYGQRWWHPDRPDEDIIDELYRPYHDAIAQAKKQVGCEMLTRAPEERAQIAEIWKQIRELEQKKARLWEIVTLKTSDLQEKLDGLDTLDVEIERMAENEVERLVDSATITPPDFDSPGDAFEDIESNGGWRGWVDDVGVRLMDAQEMHEVAQRHDLYTWYPSGYERNNVTAWMEEHFTPDADYEDATGPELSPEEMLAGRGGGE